jgi:hypothetical protein
MPITETPNKRPSAVKFVASAVFLNVLLNIRYPASDQPLWELLKLSPEALGIMLIIWLTVALEIRFRPAICIFLTVGVVFLRLFKMGDVLIPMYFYRTFNLYLDSRFLPDLFHLLYTTLSHRAFLFWTTVSGLFLVAMVMLIRFSIKTIYSYLWTARAHRWAAGVVLTGVIAVSLLPAENSLKPDRFFVRGLFMRVIEEIDFILQVEVHRDRHLQVIGSALEKSRTTPTALDKLQGADVLVFFLESYGQTIFDETRHFPLIKSELADIEAGLNARGFQVLSNFVSSPTYGGASWLAHATLSTGVHTNNQMRYNILLTSQVKTLARYFNEAGYRTVRAMPGTQWPWPQGEFYGYQSNYYAWNFDYKGPMFGWSTMPDQYVVDFIRRREMETSTQPLFVEFNLVSSHAPFHRQPPYIQDWSLIGDGAIYHDLEMITFPITWPDLSNAAQGYVSSIRYDLKVVTEFIKRYVAERAIMIILGDHQPNVQLTGKNHVWAVPVHVISRSADLLGPFKNRGFLPGLVPTQLLHRGMETLTFEFLEDFSTSQLLMKPKGDIACSGSTIKQQIKGR